MSGKNNFKVVFVGESKVGKSSLIGQYTLGKFNPQIQPSNTAQYIKKEVKLIDNSSVTLEIWDTCGETKYRNITKVFLKEVKAIVLVYDITNKNSLKELKNFWYATNKDCGAIFFVVANKWDLDDKEDEEGKGFAQSIGAYFFSVSAKDNIGLTSLFLKIAEALKK